MSLDSKSNSYTVLARKYRPVTFSDVIGQESMVQTISNAIKLQKIPHAFILTGIRGVGKTTTARIIAKALNCTDTNSLEPCMKCNNCISITASNHPDVIEMDAASKTGVDDIREIIESCSYSPTSAKYKIYIIDEVHMLSVNAFNALLKTLEEPPAHVKFIFATTESQKIPLTILSRCQRFDLKRVDNATMENLLTKICDKENITHDKTSLKIVSSCSDGSVRDALSLLDRIITLCDDKIQENIVRETLGINDTLIIAQLFKEILKGDIENVLQKTEQLIIEGITPKQILNDLLKMNHLMTKTKIIKNLSHIIELSTEAKDFINEFIEEVSLKSLGQTWQMLLKATNELSMSINQHHALEMILIRITHLSDINIKQIITKLENQTPITNNSSATYPIKEQAVVQHKDINTTQPNITTPQSFAEFVNLFQENKEPLLYSMLQHNIFLINYKLGHIQLKIDNAVPTNFISNIKSLAKDWTNQNWNIEIINDDNITATSIDEQKIKDNESIKNSFKKTDEFQNIKKIFPQVNISEITT